MSKNKILKNTNFIKLTNKSGVKPRNEIRINTFNNENFFSKAKKYDIYKITRMKPEYKKLYKDIVSRKINSESIKKNIERPKPNNKLEYKLNSFLDVSEVNKENQIIFQLNRLKFKISKNKNHSYFSVNKNTCKNQNKKIYQNFQDISLLAYGSHNKIYKNRSQNNIKNNYYNNIDNNNIKLTINKYQNRYHKSNNTNLTENEKEHNIEDYSLNKNEKEDNNLLLENSKLKRELEYSNNQLEKYRKYQALYLTLLKKVKTNTNLIKNINLNNEQNIKDQYIGELIDRGKEISTMIKEDNILENNLKDILYKLE